MAIIRRPFVVEIKRSRRSVLRSTPQAPSMSELAANLSSTTSPPQAIKLNEFSFNRPSNAALAAAEALFSKPIDQSPISQLPFSQVIPQNNGLRCDDQQTQTGDTPHHTGRILQSLLVVNTPLSDRLLEAEQRRHRKSISTSIFDYPEQGIGPAYVAKPQASDSPSILNAEAAMPTSLEQADLFKTEMEISLPTSPVAAAPEVAEIPPAAVITPPVPVVAVAPQVAEAPKVAAAAIAPPPAARTRRAATVASQAPVDATAMPQVAEAPKVAAAIVIPSARKAAAATPSIPVIATATPQAAAETPKATPVAAAAPTPANRAPISFDALDLLIEEWKSSIGVASNTPAAASVVREVSQSPKAAASTPAPAAVVPPQIVKAPKKAAAPTPVATVAPQIAKVAKVASTPIPAPATADVTPQVAKSPKKAAASAPVPVTATSTPRVAKAPKVAAVTTPIPAAADHGQLYAHAMSADSIGDLIESWRVEIGGACKLSDIEANDIPSLIEFVAPRRVASRPGA